MNNLALAYVTCDKYSHIWSEWFGKFKQYWDIELPLYFLGEEIDCPWDGWTNIGHERVEADNWTTKLREQVEQIPEDNIFVWLDDLVIQKKISYEFIQIYSLFNIFKADSFRIMPRHSKSKLERMPYMVGGYRVCNVLPGWYMVSFHPNIFTKKFLLEVLKHDENPWQCELKSRNRIINDNIYSIQIDGWLSNEIIKGIPQ